MPSMGPPPFGDGNAVAQLVFSSGVLPSMGPPPFGDGNSEWGPVFSIHLQPSMGPPPFGDGNAPAILPSRSFRYAFNGATAFRRWKHQRPQRYRRQGVPSMGPPPFGDGNTLAVVRSPAAIAPSMGPPPFGDGNRIDASMAPTPWGFLQWGHRLSAMETALCGSSAPWIHAKALFSRRIGYRINGHSVRDQLGFAAP